MAKINRIEIDEFWTNATIVEAGDYIYTSYCMKNEGQPIENQINGALIFLKKDYKKLD